MPAGTPWAEFNRARRTGNTRTTTALDALFATQDPALVAAVGSGAPFAGLPQPFLDALQNEGLDEREIQHIIDWPTSQKNRVRNAVRNAIAAGHAVRFRWKLYDDDPGNPTGPKTAVGRPANGTVTITFYNPWIKVRVVARDDVTVDVP
jgi:hypothetical protein